MFTDLRLHMQIAHALHCVTGMKLSQIQINETLPNSKVFFISYRHLGFCFSQFPRRVAKNETVRHQVLKMPSVSFKKKKCSSCCTKKKTTEAYTKHLDQLMEFFYASTFERMLKKACLYDKAVCAFLEERS